MRARQASSPRCHLLGQEVREVFGGPESTVMIREDRAAPLGRSNAVGRDLTNPNMASNSRRRSAVRIASPFVAEKWAGVHFQPHFRGGKRSTSSAVGAVGAGGDL
jgi:hypothetical protein